MVDVISMPLFFWEEEGIERHFVEWKDAFSALYKSMRPASRKHFENCSEMGHLFSSNRTYEEYQGNCMFQQLRLIAEMFNWSHIPFIALSLN
jgi:hypothetical protein